MDGKLLETRKCAVCGTVFVPNTAKQIYCCSGCNQKAQRMKKREPVVYHFKTSGNDKKIIEVDKAAQAMGLSYGHYVALKEMGAVGLA